MKFDIRKRLSGIMMSLFLIALALSNNIISNASSVPVQGGNYPGSWRKTGNYKCFGPLESPVKALDMTITAGEIDEGNAEFVFSSGEDTEESEEISSFKVSVDGLKEAYFPGQETYETNIVINWSFSSKNSPGEINVSAALADPDFSQGEDYGFLPNVRNLIPLFNYEGLTDYTCNAEKVADDSKGEDEVQTGTRWIPICSAMPDVPKEDEQRTVWIMIGIKSSDDVRMFLMWEYEWSDEQYIVDAEDMSWVKDSGGSYDAGVGVIEYDGPVETVAKFSLFTLVPAVALIVIVLAIILIIRKKRK